MGYLYKNQCYEDIYKMQYDFAGDCFQLASMDTVGTVLTCQADELAGSVTVQALNVADGSTVGLVWSYYPPSALCDYQPPPTIADSAQLAWLVVSVWVAAWDIKQIKETWKK